MVSMMLLWDTMKKMNGTTIITTSTAAAAPARAIPPEAIWLSA